MKDSDHPTGRHASPARRRRWTKPALLLTGAILCWLLVSYFALPHWWMRHESRHPALDNAPRRTVTATGIPGDPLNLLIVGTEAQLVAGLLAAGWHPADPITLKTSLRIAESSLFHRSYEEAPVSNLFLFGRKEDLAFEKPFGNDPRQRHHVRFWQDPKRDAAGTPAWWGAATFDRSIGFSHTTGQVTHHIGADIDAERDLLGRDLQQVPHLILRQSYQPGFQEANGHNGGGDPWQSDGRLSVIEMHH